MPHDHLKPALPLMAAAALLAIAGCTTGGIAQAPASGICNADAVQRLVGQPKPADGEATRLTGASIVRQIAPGDPVTEDWRENRVTIETDPTTGRVVRATCG